jgi:hypothetical protein
MSNNVKIFIAFNKDSISGKLTKLFTGCTAYHIGFIVPDSGYIYDMNLLFRRVKITEEKAQHIGDTIKLIDLPQGVILTEEDLIERVFSGVEDLCDNGSMLKNLYGFIDYIMYGFRWAYHLFGKSTPNFGGEICSEVVNNLLIDHGWSSPFIKEVPSPCDFVKYFNVSDCS